MATKKKNLALVAVSESTPALQKSFHNLGHISLASVRNLNPVSVLKHSYLVIENPEASLAIIGTRVKEKAEKATK